MVGESDSTPIMAIPVPSRQLFIDGEWKEPVSKNRLPIINPSTEETIGFIPAATAEDVNIAVEAARRALLRNGGKDWASATGAHRAKYLRAIAAKITERKSDLAKLEAIDCGKPLDEAAWDIDDVAGCFEYYADIAETLDSKKKTHISVPMETFKCHVLKEPIGVVGLITPWNYPLLMATWKVAPALAAGCTAILKPSELASITCLELGEVCREVGLPPGVLNILTGLGPAAGAPLASHPHVDKIAFTGSSATGSKIMAAAAQLVKPVTLELGGKSPIVVFEDVDLDKAAEWTLFGCFWTNGQICSATSRLIVHMEGRIAKELYSGVLQSTSIEDIGSTSTQANQNLQDSELDDLWYDDDDSPRESSVEKLKISSDMDREWQRRHDQFHTIGYRDGLIAGKEASAQEGFNIGFKDSVSIGYNWGLARGITSAMAFLPPGLKEKMVETEEMRNKYQRLHESIHSLSTTDALRLFHESQKRKPGNQNEDATRSFIDADLNNQIRDMDVLQNYCREMRSLVDESPLVDVRIQNESIETSLFTP